MTFVDRSDTPTTETFDLAGLIERTRPAWMSQGECRHWPQSWFFPERGEDVLRAKAICDTCPVANECLDYAVANGEYHGIWGGTSQRGRRRMRLQIRAV